MQNKNEITLETLESVLVMNIQGDITSFSEPYLNAAYQQATEQGSEKLLLNVEEGAYINSGGIAVLIQILAKTKKNNQIIGILCVSQSVDLTPSLSFTTRFTA
ncbi:MAG: STAS domain-containing protein [Deltaproteobacteria bacterium]